MAHQTTKPAPLRVLVFGASGTAGQAVVRAFVDEGHHVTCIVRPSSTAEIAPEARLSFASSIDTATLTAAGVLDGKFDAVVSCLASRTGTAKDAWAIDHDAQCVALETALAVGARRFVLLSAICVQKPKLAFQHAKLAFENKLTSADIDWTIVRPTAFFKSLAGQISRVKAGKPYLAFGNGELTACKPISDRDLARFIVEATTSVEGRNRVLPIGGPGPALTPNAMAKEIFRQIGKEPRIRYVPVAMMSLIVGALSFLGKLRPSLAEKAELAKIGRYYGTESMLVWDEAAGRYDANATPEYGDDLLFDYYADVIAGREVVDLGEQAVF